MAKRHAITTPKGRIQRQPHQLVSINVGQLKCCLPQDKTSQAAEVVAEKATDAGEVVLAKGKEVGSFTKEVADDLKHSVLHDAEAEAKTGGGLFGLFGRKK